MRKGYTHIAMVLDRSGSMLSVCDDTIGGVNSFIAEQKKAPGEATFTLFLFDHEFQRVYDQMNITGVAPLTSETYQPRGQTALLEAIWRTIDQTGRHLLELNEEERPEKVLIVIITDGQENASAKEYTIEKVNKKIDHQRSVYSWEFVFLGANQDAITSAAKMGIGSASTMTYAANSIGTQSAFASASANTVAYRSTCDSFSFKEADRVAQVVAGVDPALNKTPPEAA